MGSPAQFDAIRAGLADFGAELVAPSLPGHGASLREFAARHAADWQRFVRDELRTACERYDRVAAVCHSMGGLLAIEAAIPRPESLCGIIALALPLRVRITGRGLRLWTASVRKPRPGDCAELAAARALCGVEGVTLAGAVRLLPNAIGLLRLCRRGRGLLPELETPLFLFHAARDEIVSPRVPALVRATLPAAQIATLPQASHFYYSQADTAAVVSAVRALLSNPPKTLATARFSRYT